MKTIQTVTIKNVDLDEIGFALEGLAQALDIAAPAGCQESEPLARSLEYLTAANVLLVKMLRAHLNAQGDAQERVARLGAKRRPAKMATSPQPAGSLQ